MALIKFYQWPALDEAALSLKTRQTQQICAKVTRLETEWCYYVETQDGRPLDDHQLRLVQSLLGRSVQLHRYRTKPTCFIFFKQGSCMFITSWKNNGRSTLLPLGLFNG